MTRECYARGSLMLGVKDEREFGFRHCEDVAQMGQYGKKIGGSTQEMFVAQSRTHAS